MGERMVVHCAKALRWECAMGALGVMMRALSFHLNGMEPQRGFKCGRIMTLLRSS